ncbi:MAG: hypothetical protein ABI324_28305, partial [Ktedonobacteraceae bacterium]
DGEASHALRDDTLSSGIGDTYEIGKQDLYTKGALPFSLSPKALLIPCMYINFFRNLEDINAKIRERLAFLLLTCRL